MIRNLLKDEIRIRSANDEKGDDLNAKQEAIDIDPSPEEETCFCCGRPVSQLKPYDRKDLCLELRFKPVFLLSRYRPVAPKLGKKAQELYDRLFGKHKASDNNNTGNDALIEYYRREDIEELRSLKGYSEYYFEEWLCCECIELSNSEYFTKLGWDLDEHLAWVPQKRTHSKK